MKYEKINNSLFIKNRAKFTAAMEPKSVAIFNSNDIYPVSADSTMPFNQHRDIFYLSGVDQEESILVLFPDAFNEEHREMLFVRETNEHIAIWEGEKLTKEAAFETSGIKNVYWLDQFDSIMKIITAQAENLYINTNEHTRADTTVETREDRFIKTLKVKYPAHNVKKSAPILHRIRAVKETTEIELMQKACNITEKGIRRILSFIEPGVMEYEIEAELMHEFLWNRSKGFAYTPIVASGKNACVLHYIQNNNRCNDGDVILLDVGAEYANYASDLSRSLPVNGRFTDRQKQVYNAVLRVKKASEQLLVPGTFLGEYHKEVGKLMESELIGLGLLDKTDIKNQDPNWPAYKKYFMHGTSHFIGLDTHDVGLWTEPLKPGMVFTCEPGIYIQEEGLGIRLEDDLVVQASGKPFNLMGNIPIEADEIEGLMNA
ncbi:aminopeptidase P N-terminal domain-containing protein [Crocinitomix algicola]|uniref:aminopeptidase P N-terminal domain-containing protein n=1 Tax=Crocinitomix algicola TaxID=1740263 RepID=UPI00082A8C00|nr:aminopeptidase P N-terminal domain-containing protein [Crocinitomix algicola]